jgi:hypothetical protein
MILFLSGVQSRFKYFAYGGAAYAFLTYILVFRDWLRALAQMQATKNLVVKKLLERVDQIFTLIGGLVVLGFVILQIICPMVFYDTPRTLNWVYMFSFTMYAVFIVVLVGAGVRTGHLLKNLIEPILAQIEDGRELKVLVARLNELVRYGTVLIPSVLPLLLLPLWMTVSSADGSAGMQYYFYFEFTFIFFLRATSVIVVARFAIKKSEEFSPTVEITPRKQDIFLSFTIAELNGVKPEVGDTNGESILV